MTAVAGDLNHAFVSAVPDEGVATEVGPDEWNAKIKMSAGNDGQAAVRRTAAPNGWSLINLGALLTFINATQAANSGTGETDLHVFTLDAAQFDANKRKIRVTAEGSFAANANTKTLRLKLGAAGSVVLNPLTTAPNGKRFKAVVTITRTGVGAQRLLTDVRIDVNGELMSLATAAEVDTGTMTLKITGQSGTGSNDILLDETMVEFLN